MKKYTVHEFFATLQGEGLYAGQKSVFIRFAGCNMWTGDPSTRERDFKRNGAHCALFCDTEFRGGERYVATQIVAEAKKLGASKHTFVVLTGGEPLLQVDKELLLAFKQAGIPVHVETNGSLPVKQPWRELITHLVISPKQAPERIVQTECDELKVVIPRYDPHAYSEVIQSRRKTVQPEEDPDENVWKENIHKAKDFVMDNEAWSLSLQIHKYLGMR